MTTSSQTDLCTCSARAMESGFHAKDCGVVLAQQKALHSVERRADSIRPSYYTNNQIMALDVIDDWKLDFYLGNVVKYIQRAGKKDPTTYYDDLRKAMTYIQLKLEREFKETTPQ